MSGFTEPSQLPTSVKKEIKEEEFDDFLQEYLSTFKAVEEKPGSEYECKTEMNTSPIMILKEENCSPMEIKDEEEFDSREYGDFDSSPTSKLSVMLCYVYLQYLNFVEWLTLFNLRHIQRYCGDTLLMG